MYKKYKPGTFIKHKKFGTGFILEVDKRKTKYSIKVDFFEKGIKIIVD